MFWPNMAKDIATRRMSSGSCDASTPSQSAEPPITPETPEYPFQHVCSHFFLVSGHNFCLVVNRFSNWLQVFTGRGGACQPARPIIPQFWNSRNLDFGHGPKYTAEETKSFLSKLLVYHRMSSVGFPHANQKAERSVGAAKRIIRDSVKPSGELDTVTLIKGLLQPRNTPDQDNGMSPAMILLGRELRDFLPHKPKPHMTSYKEMAIVWHNVANWRELGPCTQIQW